eukprot:TRINITY_DN4231_c0_g1_i1.p1 TRINITY_DN4231_c0_g1~~TRINITY_DN4231_c0_g1_i1.p1  ORF type:complete len:96 (+),score=8.34 TRINITY_DN4231_c0_g1_i1:43-288(+)
MGGFKLYYIVSIVPSEATQKFETTENGGKAHHMTGRCCCASALSSNGFGDSCRWFSCNFVEIFAFLCLALVYLVIFFVVCV